MTNRGYQKIGLAISGGIVLLAPSAPPYLFEHAFSGAAPFVWEVFCLGIFGGGAVIFGIACKSRSASHDAAASEELIARIVAFQHAETQWQIHSNILKSEIETMKKEGFDLVAARDRTIQELREQLSNYVQANNQWQEYARSQCEELIAERDLARQHCADAQVARAQAHQECEALLAQISQLRTAHAQTFALPREMMCILENVVTAPVFEKAVVIGLHEDRAKGDDDRERARQRLLRRQMLRLFLQLLDYLRKHPKI